MVAEVVQQLSGGLLVRMVHTRDGAKIGVTCVMHGNNKVSNLFPLRMMSRQFLHICLVPDALT